MVQANRFERSAVDQCRSSVVVELLPGIQSAQVKSELHVQPGWPTRNTKVRAMARPIRFIGGGYDAGPYGVAVDVTDQPSRSFGFVLDANQLGPRTNTAPMRW